MDVVYHRNCLDGIYSAYQLYLFAKTLTRQAYSQFVLFLQKAQSCPLYQFSLKQENKLMNIEQINEEFFHSGCPQIAFSSVSMYAGQFYPPAPSEKGNILIIVDISPTDKATLIKISQNFRQILIIDHHTTFAKTKEMLDELHLKNIHYIWEEGICAAQLVLSFLHRSFRFLVCNYPKNFGSELMQMIEYVGKNDLKLNEDKVSKKFVLGFYYFQIEMSHQNPFLFKRLWSLKLETILDKGKNIYGIHLSKLSSEILNCQLCTIIRGKLKGKKMLATQLIDRGILSDSGSLLAYVSSQMLGFQNLAIIYNKSQGEIKISTRSSPKSKREPLALELAQVLGGGGHVCAAGCSITRALFKETFGFEGQLKPKIKLGEKQIEKILF